MSDLVPSAVIVRALSGASAKCGVVAVAIMSRPEREQYLIDKGADFLIRSKGIHKDIIEHIGIGKKNRGFGPGTPHIDQPMDGASQLFEPISLWNDPRVIEIAKDLEESGIENEKFARLSEIPWKISSGKGYEGWYAHENGLRIIRKFIPLLEHYMPLHSPPEEAPPILSEHFPA